MNWSMPRFGRRRLASVAGTAAAFVACACGRSHAMQPAAEGQPVTGEEVTPGTGMLATGADLLQSKGPVNDIDMYLNGFHFYADDLGRQIEAHHYCTHVTEDFIQCLIYDGNRSGARLIGIEYIVSERVFLTLPEEEKRLWHSHRHETLSGTLVMPSIPETVENMAIAKLVTTYGKTWHTWQIDRDSELPLGIPQLMMAFTADGQLRREMVEARDRALEISTAETRAGREEMAKDAPPVRPGADAWQGGQTVQLELGQKPVQNLPG
ncbi:MAG TPA: OBAP family protein [Geminicoccus sp.]|uniref:OBAP family protein n=1 Tax=Geminicoccus sp. TaxID=2024832 RepID=UPI002C44277B|nr:OBAP family protein [Geminicoccus sp.]HWL68020.1 OBAP family protein [Geminicoccus sp.]